MTKRIFKSFGYFKKWNFTITGFRRSKPKNSGSYKFSKFGGKHQVNEFKISSLHRKLLQNYFQFLCWLQNFVFLQFEVATESTLDLARKSDEYLNGTSSPYSNFQYSPSDTLYSPQSSGKVQKSSAENYSSSGDQTSSISANLSQHQKPDTKHITLDININTVEGKLQIKLRFVKFIN